MENRDTVVEVAPIVVTHIAAGRGAAVFPHTLVIAEDNAKVTVVDYFVSADSDAVPGLAPALGQEWPSNKKDGRRS